MEPVTSMAAAVLGLLVLGQGVGKWADLAGYRDALLGFELWSERTIRFVAPTWAALEVVGGVALVIAATRGLPPDLFAWGLGVVSGIGVAYTLLNGATWARGIAVGNCTCFGVFFPQRLGVSVLVQDVAVLAWCGWLWLGRAALVTG